MTDYTTPTAEYFDTPELGPEYYDLEFSYDRPPVTANQRLHWRRKADLTAGIRTTTRYLARRIPELGRCEVTLTWYVTDNRRRDADNVVPTLKAMCDGLVDAGVVADDVPSLMKKNMPVISRGDNSGLILRVARILPEAVAA